jgi:hypothetical protein
MNPYLGGIMALSQLTPEQFDGVLIKEGGSLE